jgi:hypothetical protein
MTKGTQPPAPEHPQQDTDIWVCGAYDCKDWKVAGGDTEKAEHMRAHHPDHFGTIWLPYRK